MGDNGESDTMVDSDDLEAQDTKKTILLVEDDELHAELIRRAFGDNSSVWDVHHVICIGDALKWLEGNEIPYIVIADYLLPDGTGLDLTKGALSSEEVSFPLILITGTGSEQLAVHTLKSGAMDYIVKSPEELRELPWRAERAIREWSNVTQRKRLEEELAIYAKELERAKQDLDDFTLLMEDYADKLDDLGQESLAGVQKATERMMVLIEDLLMLGRLGRKFAVLEKVNLNELLEEINSDLSALIEERRGEVIAGNLPTISTQRVWMKELFITLIENGLKYNLDGKSRVAISCEEREKDYMFKVNTNGISIEEKELSRIFASSGGLSPYEYGGTNLRLALCKKILAKFNGKIWAESGPGESTVFYFTHPKNE